MVEMKAELKFRGKSPRSILKAVKEARRKGSSAVGLHWLQKMYDRHFTTQASGRYKYQSRTLKYQQRKRKALGHTNPLVYTGTAQKVLRNAQIKGTEQRSEIRLGVGAPPKVHQYMRSRGKYGKGPYKWGELKAVTQGEAKELADVHSGVLGDAARKSHADLTENVKV
jgi:hypothetical protein